MTSMSRRVNRKVSLIAVSIACCLISLLTPGWRNSLRALDYVSLANCALPGTLQVSARIGDAPSTYSVYVGNDLIQGCNVTAPESFSVTVTYLNGGNNWISVAPASGTLQQGTRNSIRVTVTPASLPGVGTYQGFVHIRLGTANGTITIPVSVALAAPSPLLSLSWSSVVFQTVTRTGIPPARNIALVNAGTGTLDWNIDREAIPSWLSVSPTSGSLDATSTAGTLLTVGPNTANLDAGVYTALLPFRSATAKNSPQYLSVTYHVVQPSASPIPVLNAYGLSFTAQQGSTNLLSGNFNFSNTGGGTVSAQFTTSTTSGNWLSVSPSSASATSTTPATIQVTINPSGLQAGVYRGTITGTFSVLRPQTVDVMLTVTPAPPPPPPNPPRQPPTGSGLAGCTPSSMSLVGSTVGNGLNSPVSFPQALLAQLVDNCGEPITNGTVVATAGGNAIPMTNTGGGFYSGTWTPAQAAANVNITFAAFHPSFTSVQQSFSVSAITASGGTVLPVLFNEGVVEGAAFTSRRPLVPGGIVSLFGSNLAAASGSATAIPLERQIGQTSVRIGGIEAPLYFVSPGQINAQVPFESRPGDTVGIVVNVGGRITTPQNYQIAPAQPGIFVDSLGAAILDDQFRRITATNPARVGRVIQIFAGGLGDTVPPADSGEALNVGSDTTVPVSVSIGGIDTAVQYNGLAPGFVGLYQVNVTVPGGVQTGPSVPIILRQNGVPANPAQTLTIPVAP